MKPPAKRKPLTARRGPGFAAMPHDRHMQVSAAGGAAQKRKFHPKPLTAWVHVHDYHDGTAGIPYLTLMHKPSANMLRPCHEWCKGWLMFRQVKRAPRVR